MEYDLVTRYDGNYERNYGDMEFYQEHGFWLKSFDIEEDSRVVGEITVKEYEDLVFDGMPPIENNLTRTQEREVSDTLEDMGLVRQGMVWSGMIY